MKICIKCGETKELSRYHKDRNTCKDCLARSQREWRRKNKDNPKYRERAKREIESWKKKNPDYYKEYSRKWYTENKERAQIKNAAWRKRNPEAKRAIDTNRRARKSGRKGSFTAEEWNDLVKSTGNKCLCCGSSGKIKKLTQDHVIPLCKGGSNTIENIQPLCQKCNSSKWTKSTDYR